MASVGYCNSVCMVCTGLHRSARCTLHVERGKGRAARGRETTLRLIGDSLSRYNGKPIGCDWLRRPFPRARELGDVLRAWCRVFAIDSTLATRIDPASRRGKFQIRRHRRELKRAIRNGRFLARIFTKRIRYRSFIPINVSASTEQRDNRKSWQKYI